MIAFRDVTRSRVMIAFRDVTRSRGMIAFRDATRSRVMIAFRVTAEMMIDVTDLSPLVLQGLSCR